MFRTAERRQESCSVNSLLKMPELDEGRQQPKWHRSSFPSILQEIHRYTDTHMQARRHIHMCTRSSLQIPFLSFSTAREGRFGSQGEQEPCVTGTRGMLSIAALREVDLVQGPSSPARHFQCNGKALRNSFCPSEVRAVLRGPSQSLTFCTPFTEMFFPSTVPRGHLHLIS